MDQLKHYISSADTCTSWLRTASRTEILRFLRARKGDAEAAWQMLWDHSLWRISQSGPESFSIIDEQIFEESSLNEELYWAGQAYDGCPVLYFSTGLHQSGLVSSTFYTR